MNEHVPENKIKALQFVCARLFTTRGVLKHTQDLTPFTQGQHVEYIIFYSHRVGVRQLTAV